MHTRSGFTLVELLVVIAIIGGLSSLLLPNFMAAREKVRDAQRKNDVTQIQKALEIYKQDQNPPSYPDDDTFLRAAGDCWTSGGTGGACAGNRYMSKIPKDPIGRPENYYYYSRDASDTLKYTLCTCLENTADAGASIGNCSDSAYVCSSGKSYMVYEP